MTILVAATAFVVRGPKRTADLLSYHYYNGYAFVHEVTHENFLPAQSQSFLHPLLDAGYFLLFDRLPQTFAHVVVVLVHSLLFLALYALARRYFDRQRGTELIAYVLAIGGCIGSIFLGGVGAEHHDIIVGMALATALILALPSVTGDRNSGLGRSWLSIGLAGLLMGGVTGLKLTAAPYVLGIAVALLVIELRRRSMPQATAFFSIAAALGLVITGGWWMLEIHRLYGSPVFPFLNEVFQSPLVAAESFSHDRRMPRGFWQGVVYPLAFTSKWRLISALEWKDYRFAALYVGFVLWGVLWAWRLAKRVVTGTRSRERSAEDAVERDRNYFLMLVTAVSYLGWLAVFPTHRYLSGIEAIAPLVLLALVREFGLSKRTAVVATLLAVVVFAATVHPQANGGFLPPLATDEPLIPAVAIDTAAYADSMVLISGLMHSSFVIPAFPESTRFTRLQILGFGDRHSKRSYRGLYELARRRVQRFDGDLHVLYKEWGYKGGIREPRNTIKELAALGLRLDQDGCRELVRPVRRPHFICPVVRASEGAAQEGRPTNDGIVSSGQTDSETEM